MEGAGEAEVGEGWDDDGVGVVSAILNDSLKASPRLTALVFILTTLVGDIGKTGEAWNMVEGSAAWWV